MAGTVCHFEIPAGDTRALSKFYGALFGWTFAEVQGPSEGYLLARTSPEPGALLAGLCRPYEAGQGVTVYVTVDSVEETARRIEELGGKILLAKTEIPTLGWIVVAKDPEGNVVGVFEKKSTVDS
jgi:uncharacterized protein